MQVLAGEMVWIHGHAVFGLPATANVKEKPLVVQYLTAANERRMTAEYDEVAISAFCDLVEARTITLRGGRRGFIRVETIS
jgi:hypothetical protein